jgi:hypothetical protein
VDDGSHLIFDLYLIDFIAEGKKTKMIFVSAEQSKAKQATELFKNLYDGKSYLITTNTLVKKAHSLLVVSKI